MICVWFVKTEVVHCWSPSYTVGIFAHIMIYEHLLEKPCAKNFSEFSLQYMSLHFKYMSNIYII